MKILHLLRAPMGGVLRHVNDVSRALVDQGHAVGIICDIPGTDGYNEARLAELDAILPLGVTRVAMKRSVGPSDIGAIRKISAIIDQMEPDVLHGHGAKGGLFARRCGSGSPARFYSPHGGSLHFDPHRPSGMLFFQVERWLQHSTDRMLFVADYERRTYEEKVGPLRCNWSIVYNGLQDDEFVSVDDVQSPADFIYIGEMRDLKGVDMILEGLSALKAEGRPHRCAFVGAGPQKADYVAMASSLGLADSVVFHAPMPARAAFALGKVVVLPSRAEAMPYIVLEALAAHKPVITTTVGGIPEIFEGHTHMLAKPETRHIVLAMRKASASPSDWQQAMPEIAELKKRFSIVAMTGAVVDAYMASLVTMRANGTR